LGLRDVAVGRLAKPQRGIEIVLRHAETVGVHIANIELGRGEALLRRLEVILECRREIGRHPAAEFVHHPKVEERRRKTAVRGLLIQLQGLRQVPRHAVLAVGGKITKGVQRLRITLLGPRTNRRYVDLRAAAPCGRAQHGEHRRKNAGLL
jgi:hypothetical protein